MPYVWFFDLDNTLHDASHAMFGRIDQGMTEYVMRELGVDREESTRIRLDYWRRYGASMLGLVRHHGVRAQHFLDSTHDFDPGPLLRYERGLARALRRLPGRKVVLTNAPRGYADRVLAHMGVTHLFARNYAVETMRIHGTLRPKPSRLMLRAMLARERIRAGRAVLVDDSADNLRAARSVGLRTVLVAGRATPVAAARRIRPAYADLKVESVLDLPRSLRSLR